MATPERPNVLLLVSDQHHPDIAGFAGDPLADTPNLDRLAGQSVRFSEAHAACPLCGPSRMSLMTGRLPSETGCLTNQTQLRSDEPTFAHAFNRAGYDTAIAGRMHFSGWDQRHGFRDRLIGDAPPTAYLRSTPPSIWRLHEVLGDLWPSVGPTPQMFQMSGPGETGYLAFDRAVAEKSVAWLRERAASPSADPFMLTVGFMAPHCPFICEPEDFYAFYDRIGPDDLPDPRLDTLSPAVDRLRRGYNMDPPPPVETQRVVRAAYYGLVRFLDRQIGRILEALEDGGLDNTIVVYTSDHGEQLGEHGLWQKMTFYRGSIGVPLLVADPRRGRATVTRNVSLSSLGPTLLDAVGADPIPGATLPSFHPLLVHGDQAPWADEVVSEYVHWGPEIPAQRMVRRGPWKLFYTHGEGSQLFNVERDPGELEDRARDPGCAALVASLEARALADWDPAQQERERARWLAGQAFFDEWVEAAQPPEPEPPWFDTPPENRLDPIPGSRHR